MAILYDFETQSSTGKYQEKYLDPRFHGDDNLLKNIKIKNVVIPAKAGIQVVGSSLGFALLSRRQNLIQTP
jgi:hypothetical protein